ncbi:hypothetical protein HEK616_06570 [Streptomyces nigrescens]|uniref:Uncharacterized protein n=1 Tax=Streptomyces nigrescens TaxID=1920 RepID=A0ABM7ZLA3_STRNI|nr:hypothetical protein HEK616_06570 [Streptomyces nigrescens]
MRLGSMVQAGARFAPPVCTAQTLSGVRCGVEGPRRLVSRAQGVGESVARLRGLHSPSACCHKQIHPLLERVARVAGSDGLAGGTSEAEGELPPVMTVGCRRT